MSRTPIPKDTEHGVSPAAGLILRMQASVAPCALSVFTLREAALAWELDTAPARRAGAAFPFRAALRGVVDVAGAEVELRGVAGEETWLHGRVSDLRFSALLREFLPGVEIPPEVPDLTLSLDLRVNPGSGAFRFAGSAVLQGGVPSLGLPAGTVRAEVEVERVVDERGARVRASLRVEGAGPFTLVEGVSCEGFGLRFRFAQGESCSVEGALAATVLGHRLALSAGYEHTAEVRRLRLASTGSATVTLAGAEFSFGGFALELARTRSADGGEGSTSWRVGGTGGVTLRSLFAPGDVWSLHGTLALASGAAGTSLALDFHDSSLPFTLPTGGEPLRFTVVPRRLAVVRDRDGWAFEAASGFAVSGLPDFVQRLLPERTEATLRVDGSGVTLTADRLLAPVPIPLPDIQGVDGETIPLGSLLFAVSDLRVKLGAELSLSAQLRVGLPPEIDHLFGTRTGADGRVEPRTRVFETYDPASPTAGVGVRLGIGLRDGSPFVEAAASGLPFRGFAPDADGSCTLELGEFGSARFRFPVFRFDPATGSFQAEGEFTHRNLQIPLAPLRSLLSVMGLGELAQRLPTGIPLRRISLLDERGEIDGGALVALLEEVLGAGAVTPEAGEAIRTLAGQFNHLPGRLRDYLSIEVPEHLAFRLAVTADGGVRVHVSTSLERERHAEGPRKQVPVRLLLPNMGPTGPVLQGVRLYGLSFGSLLGGQLFRLDVDAEVDQFELLPLAVAMGLDAAGVRALATADRLYRTLVVRDLVTLIVWQTQVPVPLPLFYEELGVRTCGLEGVEVGSRWRFPLPRLNLKEILDAFGELRRFVTEEEYLIDPEAMPRDMDLRWTIGENYLQLPPWLGGDVVGRKGGDVAVVSLAQSVARVLNAVKDFAVADLVEAVPIEHRVGEVRLALGPISLQAAWLVASLAEYPRAVAASGEWRARAEPIRRVVELTRLPAPGDPPVPTEGPEGDKGVVTFLAGRWEVGSVAAFEVVAGLVAARKRGFATGYRVGGRINGLLDLELEGLVYVAPREGKVEIGGRSHLALFGRRVFEGAVRGDNQSFALEGELDLFGWHPGSPVQATAFLSGFVSRDTFSLSGRASLTCHPLTLAGATLQIAPGRMEVTGTWLNRTLRLEVTGEPGRLAFRGGFDRAVGIRDVFELCATGDRERGPTVVLAGPENPEFLFDCELRILGGLTSSSRVAFSRDGFHADFAGSLFGLYSCRGTLEGTDLLDPAGVRATVHLEDGFQALADEVHRRVSAMIEDARGRVAAVRAGAEAARAGFDAHMEAEKARLHAEAEARRGTADRDIAEAMRQVEQARSALWEIDARIAAARAEVQRDRDRVEGDFRRALDDLSRKRAELDVIQRELDSHYHWYYHQLNDWDRFWNAVPFSAKAGALEVAKGVAHAALNVASGFVEAARQAKDAWHPDADPRVTTPLAERAAAQAALDVASGVLQAARSVVGGLPDWVLAPELIPTVAAQNLGNFGLDGARELLRATEDGLATALRIGDRLHAGATLPVQVRSLTFTTSLACGPLPRVATRARVAFLQPGGGFHEEDLDLEVNFANLGETAAGLAQRVLALPA